MAAAEVIVPAPEVDESKTESPAAEATEEIKEATPEPDSAAKPKKEKVKKKWSFRSISFGKKDKQKPSKKDKKNEDNKAVAEGGEEKVEGEEKPADVLEALTAEVAKPLEAVVETIKEVAEEVKEEIKVVKEEIAAALAPEPVPAVAEPVKTPEPVVSPPQPEEKVENPVAAVVEEVKTIVEETKPIVVEEVTPPAVEELPVEVPVVEEAPAIPATPPPSQFSVFAESMTETPETLPAPVVEAVEETLEADVAPVASEMVEQVLEKAVDHVEAEIAERVDDEELPPPPADDLIESSPAVAEVVVEVKTNGVGDHHEEPVETAKVSQLPLICSRKHIYDISIVVNALQLENGVHNGDDVNESEPIVEELKKEVGLRPYRLHIHNFTTIVPSSVGQSQGR